MESFMLDFDAITTLALASLVLIIGHALKQHIPFFSRYNLPPSLVVY
jgi:sodium--glutamate symport carrier gltS